MTAADIARVVITVGVLQLLCDMIAYWRIFSQASYQSCLEKLSRAKFNVENLKSKKSNEKNQKKLQRSENDYSAALGNVARKHSIPNFMTSTLFVILLRIMGAEYKGIVFGVLPFTPWKFVQRITARGLDMIGLEWIAESKVSDLGQACSFFVIYVLATVSIKYYVSQITGVRPPKGAESVAAMVDTPQGRRMMRSLGLDPADLKLE